MKNKILFLLVLMLLMSCQKKDFIQINDIERKNTEIVVYLNNPTNNNYYLLAPQCQIDDHEYYFHGQLDRMSYSKSKVLDSIIYSIYKSDREMISIVSIPAKSKKKIIFNFNKDVGKYPNTTFYSPFNMKHEKLKILTNILEKEKIISGYSFYSDSIIQKKDY